MPGSYTVRLAAGGKTMTQPLTVLIDPREAKDGVTIADLREQFQHNMRVRDMVSEVNQLVANVESARQRLQNAGGAGADTLRTTRRAAREARDAGGPLQQAGAAGAHPVPVLDDDAGRPEDRPRRDRTPQGPARRARPASGGSKALLGVKAVEHGLRQTGTGRTGPVTQ